MMVERRTKLQEIGCIVTLRYFGIAGQPCELHHLLNESGQRYDDEHQMTIGLREWYRLGVRPTNRYGTVISTADAIRSFGPSMALNKLAFEKRFGTELDLLGFTNDLIARMQR